MRCKNCGMEFEGNFCPNCGVSKDLNSEMYSTQNDEEGNMNYNDIPTKKHKLLGFRSNKLWKKVVSVIYMIIVGLFVIGSTSEIDSINDAIISIQGILTLISPYVFLSNFKLRTLLPLFKENKKSKSFLGLVCVNIVICLFCYMINPSTHCEHKWVEIERTMATCNEEGYVKLHCDLCDSDNTEYIDKIEHVYEPVKGKDIVVCAVCGDRLEETTTNKEDSTTEKTTHKHSWDKATCEQPSICKDCGITKGDALGHSTDCGICTRCDKEFRKQSPITILNWTYTIDYAGGVEWSFNIKNNTDKQPIFTEWLAGWLKE